MIIQIAARSQRPKVLQLMLVARRMKEWVEPILYEVITLRGLHSAARLLQTLRKRPGLGTFVKALCTMSLHGRDRDSYAVLVVDACPCVEDLAARSYDLGFSTLNSRGSLRRLSINVHDFSNRKFGDALRTPAFANITHFSVSGIPVGVSTFVYGWDLHPLVSLTHLRLRFDDWIDDEAEIVPLGVLVAAPQMRLLLVEPGRTYVMDSWVTAAESALTTFDPRLVFFVSLRNEIQDWEASTQGEKDGWTRGEEHVLVQQASRRQDVSLQVFDALK
ncbi:hypothetical protein PLICRDRAFT_126775 [Plicaturopsis crispa FD-325 SS-3]|uniref:F-box domain-containing protein n=1 Tax=Plicaturopsis crispa FD-325 SS-3 TaxID=944288 RepID=A0A0C9SXQ7_PLICR|nr:hypothetical protein PLICRDRAFT_126775 [Plicaturopsis crispa FD-325 SS-3]